MKIDGLTGFNKYSKQPIYLALDMIDTFSGCPESGDILYQYFIYTLSDETGVRYVGQTNSPSIRLSSHMCNGGRGRDKTQRGQWIKSLMDTKKTPLMIIVETCPIYLANEREHRWFDHYNRLGCDLLNGLYKR